MSAPHSRDLDVLASEVASLRRRVRLYGRMLAATCTGAAAAAVLFAAHPLSSQATRIVAQEITLVDQSGRTRGVWSGDEGIALHDSALALYNTDGARRLLVNTAGNEPTIYFLDAQNRARMFFDLDATDQPRLGMNDDQGRQRLFLSVDARRIPALLMTDEDGKRRLLVNVENGEPTQNFIDADGRWRLYLNGGAQPKAAVYDAQGRARGTLSVDDEGMPSLTLSDAVERRRAVLNADNDAGRLLLFDGNGGVSARLQGR